MLTSLKISVVVVFALTVNAQKNFGSNCRNVNCASSQQCLGLYEPCKAGLVEGSTCGFYASCLDLDGEVKQSERVSSTSNVGNDQKSTDVVSSNKTSSNSGQLYPNLPQPDQPSAPQGGYYPQNPQGGYYPPNPQGGYYPPNPQGGYYPPNPQGGYYPPNPQGYPNNPPPPASDTSGSKKEGESGLGSFLNFFSGGNRGSSGSSGGPDLGSLLSVLGKGNSNPSSSSGSGGIDFSGLLSAFTGSGGRGSNQNTNTRNDFDNRNPTGQVGPNQPYNGNAGPNQNPNQAQDSGPSFLQTLGNFASSPLGQQLLVNALRSRDTEDNAQQNRRYGGLFSENTSRTTQNGSEASSKGYPTQAPYTP
ncbi:annexin A7-like [Bradysia coprophila]|uniref:annexin A7-like n=1 Tax=Bradysia coprophila TaxID=38358 RepID=UPI00187D92A8|nr:annexin A7-like [Bradysia coprophila]